MLAPPRGCVSSRDPLYRSPMRRPFLKMNGLGNDFVVVEARSQPFAPSEAEARAIADRASGVGCDQLIAIESSPKADAFMRIWNADGGQVEQCGNAARCVGWLLMQATGRDEVSLDTPGGLLHVSAAGDHKVTIDMGKPGLDWRDIPLAEPIDTRGALALFLRSSVSKRLEALTQFWSACFDLGRRLHEVRFLSRLRY